MSVITCFRLAARGHTVHGGPIRSAFFIDPGGGKAVTSFRTGPNKGPGACGVVFHFPRKLNHLERLFSDGGLRVEYRWSPWHDLLGSDECVVRWEAQKRHSHSSYDNFNETGKEIFLHQDHGCLNWLNFEGKLKVMAVNGPAEISDPRSVI